MRPIPSFAMAIDENVLQVKAWLIYRSHMDDRSPIFFCWGGPLNPGVTSKTSSNWPTVVEKNSSVMLTWDSRSPRIITKDILLVSQQVGPRQHVQHELVVNWCALRVRIHLERRACQDVPLEARVIATTPESVIATTPAVVRGNFLFGDNSNS